MTAIVTGSFDDLRSANVRFLEEAAKSGELTVLLWSDEVTEKFTGRAPKFPVRERLYFIESLRYVAKVVVVREHDNRDSLAAGTFSAVATWVVDQHDDTPEKRRFCQRERLDYRVISKSELRGFPLVESAAVPTDGRKKVLVTGCYDWLHTGHVRFFEEVSEYGDVYAVVGHDANILLLKGAGHPQFGEDERRYMVGALKHVKQALVSTGNGWLDAEPEIEKIHPDVYAVNEDGDKPEKKDYCREHGIQYLVLKRLPKEGLPRRASTVLRGF